VIDRIKTLLPQLRSSLPPSVQVSMLTDRRDHQYKSGIVAYLSVITAQTAALNNQRTALLSPDRG
jgi:hypothetical protein